MKISFLIISILINILVYSQTKQETINWLNEKLGANQTLFENIGQAVRTLKINKDGSFVVTQISFIGRDKWYSTFTGNFKDFLLPSIVSTRSTKEKTSFASADNTFITIYTKGKKIKQTDYEKNKEISDSNIKSIYFHDAVCIAVIPMPDKQLLVERCKKAFKRLISLCGGDKNKEAY